MEFSGQYLTYEEYRALGGTLDLTSFNLLEFEARNQIDLRTHNRLVNEETIPQKVKICEFNLIEKINSYKNTADKISDSSISSENIDGYSVSYITPSEIKEIIKSKNSELQDLMINDLYGIVVNGKHILYNGV